MRTSAVTTVRWLREGTVYGALGGWLDGIVALAGVFVLLGPFPRRRAPVE